ncbi:NAD-dependent epimerase/dehydratase family protein [Candidatus Omnitrophota bacterium]
MTGRNKKPDILIIGASGFIGSSLTKKLLSKGHKVRAIIGQHGLRYLEGVRDSKLKVCPHKELKNNYKKLGKFKFLFNLSGHVDIRESFRDPLKYETNKPATTIKLIENLRTEKFINISTGSVYDFAYNPVSEKNPLSPASPYAISQLSADYYTEVLCNYHKIPYLILRLFNPYGPPNRKRGIIATIINGLLEGKAVTLYNPDRKFDFTFIDDMVEAMDFCAAKSEGIINIGCGRPVSLLEVYRKISFILYKEFRQPHLVRPDGHKEEVFSNSNKLKRSGFKFRYNIGDGLRKTIGYCKEFNQSKR